MEEIDFETVTVTCRTKGCLNKDLPIEIAIPVNIPSAGVYCGGGCQNLLHAGNDIEPEPALTLEDQIDERLRQLELIN